VSAATTLLLVRDESDAADAAEGADADDVVPVESALREVPAAEFERIYRRVSEADVEADTDLPLYGAIRIHFAFLFAQNDHPPMAITHLIVLYRLLDERLRDGDYDRLRPVDLPPNYRAVAVDVAREHDVAVDGAGRFGFRRAAVGMVAGLWRYLLLVAAQILAVVWRRLHRRLGETETVVVPHLNRFDSTRPVIDALDGDYEVVLPTPTVSWLRHRNGRHAALREYDPTPLDYFATPATMAASLWRGARLGVEVLVTRSFDRRLRSFLREEFDASMPNTVWYLLGNLFAVHVPSLANAVLAERMLEELRPERLVVGSLGSRQTAILYPAIAAGVDTYHVPHSATTGYELLPPPETTHFVTGKHVVDHLDASEQTSTVDNLAPAGRPQLTAVADREPEPRTDYPDDAVRVVVATQAFPDGIRERFVADVLDGLAACPQPLDVVVKTHPNETAEFYETAVADRPYPVRVATEDLHGYLAGADLVVTINSNVGLEAMALGTPVACVVEHSPLVRARPYATAGPVPVLRSREAVAEFFADLDRAALDELTAAERAFVQRRYLHDDAAAEIARTVSEGDGTG